VTNNRMLISTGSLARESLAGQVAVVTSAGGGIGFEAITWRLCTAGKTTPIAWQC